MYYINKHKCIIYISRIPPDMAQGLVYSISIKAIYTWNK